MSKHTRRSFLKTVSPNGKAYWKKLFEDETELKFSRMLYNSFDARPRLTKERLQKAADAELRNTHDDYYSPYAPQA